MRKGYKARPHDLKDVLTLQPELIEIHASSEDLLKPIEGEYDIPLVVHLPEYDGTTLLDPASLDDGARESAVAFYNRALNVTRDWGVHFKGTPKAILHPGGWSSDEKPVHERRFLYDAFHATMMALNQVGVDLLVENMPPHPWFYGGQWHCSIFMNPKECRDICTGNGYGFCFDVCHAFLYCNSINKAITIQQFMSIVKPITAHVHISDGRGTDGEGTQVGDGEMPMAEIFRYLKDMPIGIVPEIWLGHKNGFEGFKLAWERLMSYNGDHHG